MQLVPELLNEVEHVRILKQAILELKECLFAVDALLFEKLGYGVDQMGVQEGNDGLRKIVLAGKLKRRRCLFGRFLGHCGRLCWVSWWKLAFNAVVNRKNLCAWWSEIFSQASAGN